MMLISLVFAIVFGFTAYDAMSKGHHKWFLLLLCMCSLNATMFVIRLMGEMA